MANLPYGPSDDELNSGQARALLSDHKWNHTTPRPPKLLGLHHEYSLARATDQHLPDSVHYEELARNVPHRWWAMDTVFVKKDNIVEYAWVWANREEVVKAPLWVLGNLKDHALNRTPVWYWARDQFEHDVSIPRFCGAEGPFLIRKREISTMPAMGGAWPSHWKG